MYKLFTSLMVAVIMGSCIHAQAGQTEIQAHAKPHMPSDAAYRIYTADTNSMADIDKAMARARLRDTKVLVVMGANWCHDSRGFAARMDQPEFKALVEQNYELVYVNVGAEPGQKNQNRAVSKRFGVAAIVGTPTVFIVGTDGSVLNPYSAGYWRNTDSIPEDINYAYLAYYADK